MTDEELSEEEFVTNVFQSLVLPRGPVSHLKFQTFKYLLNGSGDQMTKNRIKVQEDDYVTLVCNTSFAQVKNLRFECPNCEAKFEQIASLTQHIGLFHPQPVLTLTIEENSSELKPVESKLYLLLLSLGFCKIVSDILVSILLMYF